MAILNIENLNLIIIISHLFNSLVTTHYNSEGSWVQNKVDLIDLDDYNNLTITLT